MGILAVVVADTHANSLSGLCPPTVNLEERCHIANEIQSWYWARWYNLWNEVVPQEKQKTGAKEVWTFVVGDGADDNSHSKAGLISLLEQDITTIGAAVLEPVEKASDRLFLFRGTPAHTRQYGALEEMVARQLNKVVKSPDGTLTWWHGYIEVAGVLIHCQHKSPSYARRPWTVGGGVNRSTQILASRTAFKPEYASYRTRLAFWAHGHYAAESTVVTTGWKGYFCPPWQAMTDYGYQIGASDIDPPGAWIAYCDNGEAAVHLKTYPLPQGKIWRADEC